jgi:hypothetical protein
MLLIQVNLSNALDFNQIEHLVEVHKIDEIYLMAALLSATAEKTLLLGI